MIRVWTRVSQNKAMIYSNIITTIGWREDTSALRMFSMTMWVLLAANISLWPSKIYENNKIHFTYNLCHVSLSLYDSLYDHYIYIQNVTPLFPTTFITNIANITTTQDQKKKPTTTTTMSHTKRTLTSAKENSSFSVMEEPRQVVRKFLARPQHEGVGAIVRRSIGRCDKLQSNLKYSFLFLFYLKWVVFVNWVYVFLEIFRFELRYFDPFLVLDEFSGGFSAFLLCSLLISPSVHVS